MMLEIDI